MNILTFDEFMSDFRVDTNLTFNEWCDVATVETGVKVVDYLEKNSSICGPEIVYKILYVEYEKLMFGIYKQFCEDNIAKYFHFHIPKIKYHKRQFMLQIQHKVADYKKH